MRGFLFGVWLAFRTISATAGGPADLPSHVVAVTVYVGPPLPWTFRSGASTDAMARARGCRYDLQGSEAQRFRDLVLEPTFEQDLAPPQSFDGRILIEMTSVDGEHSSLRMSLSWKGNPARGMLNGRVPVVASEEFEGKIRAYFQYSVPISSPEACTVYLHPDVLH